MQRVLALLLLGCFLCLASTSWAQPDLRGGAQLRTYPQAISVKAPPYNAVCDGVADDTAALQAVFDAYGAVHNTSGSIEFPQGRCRITAGLTYEGNAGTGLHISGALGGSRSPQGSIILYDGAVGGTILTLLGVNGLLLENMEFVGNAKAKVGVHFDADNVTGGGSCSLQNVVRRNTVSGLVGPENIAFAFGHVEAGVTNCLGDYHMYDNILTGDRTSTGAGIRMLQGGNVKNFLVQGGWINGFEYAIDWLYASGVLTVTQVFGYSHSSDFRIGGGTTTIKGWENESTSSRFIVGSTGSNEGAVTVIGSSIEASTPSDDIFIDMSGSLTLLGNTFRNLRTAGAVPRIKLGGEMLLSSVVTSSNFVSVGNWYQNATGGLPIKDGSGNVLSTDPTSYYHNKDVSIMSIGDAGGDNGAMNHLAPQLPETLLRPRSLTLTELGAAPEGTVRHCSNCLHGSNPCSGSSTGAIAKRLNSAWACN